jgi:hypothetical protein
MKVSKNNFDIKICAVSSCKHCALGIDTKECCWMDIFQKASFNCGGVRLSSLSNIFAL